MLKRLLNLPGLLILFLFRPFYRRCCRADLEFLWPIIRKVAENMYGDDPDSGKWLARAKYVFLEHCKKKRHWRTMLPGDRLDRFVQGLL
jgi:hypothetical protein